ncbi:MAG: sugar phosphate isomerase/epimerase [Clostridia bacterium]|nr:sugar phosphate isomerase/epimerase [Clostridia bacterium]
MSFPVAVQLYSVRDNMAEDFEGTIKKVKEMGYDGVEFAGLYDNAPEKVKAICEENGLVPISAHVSYDELAADPEKVIGDYATIGVKYIAIPYAVEERRPGAELFDETVEGIRKFAGIAKKYGITMLYHNHDFEFKKVDGVYGLDLLYSTLSADELQTELDTCWVNVGGENPADYVVKYSGRAPVVHLKDFVMSGKDKPAKMYALIGIDDGAQSDEEEGEDFAFRPVGYGVQDMPAILEACKKAGTGWVVVEQDSPSMGKTPLESIKMSIDYIKTINN